MAVPSLESEVSALRGKVTALTMLVESLLTDVLSRDEDPALIGRHMVEHQFKADEAVRKKVGETAYSLEISEMISSLIDRAVARAISLRTKRHPPK